MQINQYKLASLFGNVVTDATIHSTHVAIDYHANHLDHWLDAIIDKAAGKLMKQIVPEDELMRALTKADIFIKTVAVAEVASTF